MTKKMEKLIIEGAFISYGRVSWNKDDLFSAKNGAWQVYLNYGMDDVVRLDNMGLFGNLDTMVALER